MSLTNPNSNRRWIFKNSVKLNLKKLDKPVTHKIIFDSLDIALNQVENDAITSIYNFSSNKIWIIEFRSIEDSYYVEEISGREIDINGAIFRLEDANKIPDLRRYCTFRFHFLPTDFDNNLLKNFFNAPTLDDVFNPVDESRKLFSSDIKPDLELERFGPTTRTHTEETRTLLTDPNPKQQHGINFEIQTRNTESAKQVKILVESERKDSYNGESNPTYERTPVLSDYVKNQSILKDPEISRPVWSSDPRGDRLDNRFEPFGLVPTLFHAPMPYHSNVPGGAYGPAPDSWLNSKPAQFTKRTDLDTWWKRFELYVTSAKVPSVKLRNCLLTFLDDECLSVFDNCTPQVPLALYDLSKQMQMLFGTIKPISIDAKEDFYSRRQRHDEDAKSYFEDLWRLAKIAFRSETSVFNVDAIVRDRFLNGLNNPYLMMQLSTKETLLMTSFEALKTSLGLVSRLDTWKSKCSDKPATQPP
ncbi:hypothetical protein BpHYR1_033939 [Brachionus plicatilis]|uniref:Uncharacterized protein n=1 Tax=Brachionus plicatilis TaxID=10195 RepID=A0A3M7PYF5_BRAPC|nr:hypothetical protein BpHYR1_033939 [Brachionus plicatilis]